VPIGLCGHYDYRPPARTVREERFRSRRKAWLRQVWWAFPLAALMVVATEVILALVFTPKHPGFVIGFGLGGAAGMVIALVESPPWYIESWRVGAEGEKRTARAVRALLRDGWILLNDLPRGPANIDHVLIGPPGVFLLESKNLSGSLSVSDDKLSVRWRGDAEEDPYVNRTIGGRARGGRRPLPQASDPGGTPPLGAVRDRPQGTVEDARVIWTQGDQRPAEPFGVLRAPDAISPGRRGRPPAPASRRPPCPDPRRFVDWRMAD
jgi:Nuclease-related domain